MTHEPHDIDCEEVLDRLYAFIDGELTPQRSEEVRRHLEACAHCMHLARFETAFVRFLEARARARDVPDALRKRVLERILFESGEHRTP